MAVILVHIGKCGGSSASNIFKNIQYKIDNSVHINKLQYNSQDKYIILIRNPIKRFISAFNWRYRLVCDEKSQDHRFPKEKELLERYSTVNNLAESINTFSGYIHHIHEDIHYYIGSLLQQCKKENILAVLTTETLQKDFQRLFDVDISKYKKIKENNLYDTTLSAKGYEQLKKYLRKDYECIEKLNSLGCLTQEQYAILSL